MRIVKCGLNYKLDMSNVDVKEIAKKVFFYFSEMVRLAGHTFPEERVTV